MNLKSILSSLLFIVTFTTFAQQDIPSTAIQGMTTKWNSAEATRNTTALADLYADTIYLYHKKLAKKACIEQKKLIYKKYKNYSQEIYGKINVEKTTDGIFKSNFVKKVTFNGKSDYFDAYLSFAKKGDKWVIVEESDKTTDANLKAKALKKKNKAKYDLIGDFNGDGKLDTAYLTVPKIDSTGMDCVGDCTCRLRFSDHSIPEIIHEGCLGGELTNLGDLNDNGTDEIGWRPFWFTSCWSAYYTYTLLNNKWKPAVKPFTTHDSQFDEGVIPIEKDKKRAGHAIIRTTEFLAEEGTTKVVSKSVPLNK